jgi:hypothetical protein
MNGKEYIVTILAYLCIRNVKIAERKAQEDNSIITDLK